MVMIMIIVVSFIAFVETSAAWAQGFCCRVGMCSRGLRNLNSNFEVLHCSNPEEP